MKTRLLFTLFAGIGLVAPLPTYADNCSADAEPAGYHSIEQNKYLFTFNVRSDGRQGCSCRGYVSYAIKYHHAGGNQVVLTDRTLVGYSIASGRSTARVSQEHWVSYAGAKVVIDDVAVEKVSCPP